MKNATTSKVLATRFMTINDHTIKMEYILKGCGQIVKMVVAVNDITWIAINYFNFKKSNQEQFDFIERHMSEGAYKMFINK